MNKSESGKMGALASLEIIHRKKLERRERYNKSPARCRECLTPLPFESRKTQKFCGHRCSAIFLNRTKVLTGPPRTRTYCEICDKPHKMPGPRCRLHEQDHQAELGLILERGTIKKWLVKKRGHRCENCSSDVWLGMPIPLELDHIDGNAGHNLPANLRLLCPNCHAQMPTSKGRNRGNGRKSRGLPKH